MSPTHVTHPSLASDPFDERIDYSKFAAFYPMEEISASPARFLRCLRALRRTPSFVRRMRRGLKEARRQLGYTTRGAAATNTTAYSGALDQLLVSAVSSNRHTPKRMVRQERGVEPWMHDLNMASWPLPLAEPRKGRNALDLREACGAIESLH